MPVELSVVIPAHDEEAGIVGLLEELVDVLEALAIAFEIIVVDDASTDGTPALLDELAEMHPSMRVLHLPVNRGHGPALWAGWELADGAWVGHLDGDGEISPAGLAALWTQRHEGDLLLGVRVDRSSGPVRRTVSAALRVVVRLAARQRIADANVPCKLVRRKWMAKLSEVAPADAFAPSVLLAVTVARGGGRIVEVPVHLSDRPPAPSWLVPRRLAVGCARSLRETVTVARKL